jgi:hypothetical protein
MAGIDKEQQLAWDRSDGFADLCVRDPRAGRMLFIKVVRTKEKAQLLIILAMSRKENYGEVFAGGLVLDPV